MSKNKSAIDLSSVSVFSELSKRELSALERLMTEVTVADGTSLTRQGEVGREFMIITDGTARVEIDGATVAHLSSGDFFGELAIISGTPRTATVIATSSITLMVLNRREFMAMLDESNSLSKKVLVGAVKRLQINDGNKTN